jgi:hypothetical protein
MLKRILVFALMMVATISVSGHAFAARTDKALAVDPDAGVPTEDHRYEFPPTLNPQHGKLVVPNLAHQRATYWQERGFAGLPVPGGLGSGTLYRQGELQVSIESVLRTQMIVYPAGMPLPSNWLFTTATNRTEKTVEVVGIYYGAGPGSIGVYDWSCLPDWPCPNGTPGPSWQWTSPLSSQPCYVAEDRNASSGEDWLYYQNQSKQLRKANRATPPLWQNTVKFWNYCTRVWDIVYTHQFRAYQKDCSVDGSCGWWGPIIETFFADPQPTINPLGFRNTTLFHDGVKSRLGPDETDWVLPAFPWQTYYLKPNSSWIVGP